jgi:hypothetical protein
VFEQVKGFMSPTLEKESLGPGYYDTVQGTRTGPAPDLSKMTSRMDARGPFGEKPAAAHDLPAGG